MPGWEVWFGTNFWVSWLRSLCLQTLEMEEEKVTIQQRHVNLPCSYLWFGAIPNNSSKSKDPIPFIFFLSLWEYQLQVIERKHFHGISPNLIVLQSLETISRALARTHLQNIEFGFYALFLPLCRGYFDVYYTVGLIKIIVEKRSQCFLLVVQMWFALGRRQW